MKKIQISVFAFSLIFAFNINAQSFQHNIDDATTLAKENDKHILMIFSGSDWCKPCIKMRKEIMEDASFVSYSDENLVLLELDFPYKKKNRLDKAQQKHNENLADIYNKEGAFPKVLLLDRDEKVIGHVPYKKSMMPEEFIAQIKALL